MTSDSIPPTLRAASEPTPEPAPDPATGGPGQAIRRARERAGLSVEDFAAQLKLARPTLEALERDDFKALNEPVYVRGYYRKCAKALALQETELLAAYERLVGPPVPPAPTKLLIGSNPALSRARIGRDSDGAGLGRSFGIVLVAVLIGGGAWYVSHESNGGVPHAAPVPVPVPVPLATLTSPPPPPAPPAEPESAANAAPAPAAQPAPAASAPAQTIAPPPAQTAAPAAAQTTAAPAPVAAPAPAAGDAAGGLLLNFKATSWIRVEDADGRVLLSGVIQSGDRQVLHGKPPYALFVGNGPGVVVEYDGRTIDLAPYIKQNQTARLSVP